MKRIKQTNQQYLLPVSGKSARNALALTAAIMAAGSASSANAQETTPETAPVEEAEMAMEMEEEPEVSAVSGSISFFANTHFISYGADVWATGTAWDSPTFNPAIDLTLDIGGGFSLNTGIWLDMNKKAPTSIGDSPAVQEVDVWVGVGYAYGDWSFSLTYQEWMYGGQNERIVDIGVSYDHWLAPSLTIHNRIDNGFDSDINGTVGVLGVAPGMDAGPVGLSFPVSVAFNTEDFHGGDAGLTFVSAGVGASYPLEFLPGDWSLEAGVTAWYTPDSTVPNNPDEFFVTGSLGLALGF